MPKTQVKLAKSKELYQRRNLLGDVASSPGFTKQSQFSTIHEYLGNSATRRLIEGAKHHKVQRQYSKEDDRAIGYVGLNPAARIEARTLRRGARDRVVVSLDNPKKQSVLGTREGKTSFVEGHLGINHIEQGERFALALKCLEQCDSAFIEQMAEMMEMFWGAENRKYQLERLVLSGHHAGGEMWGDSSPHNEPGKLLLERDLPNLATAFPGAAAQVEDVMFSACNSTKQVDLCKKIFPNLKSVWVYKGYSPSIKQGSSKHITDWERRTRGKTMPRQRDRLGSVEIWTSDRGFLDK